MKAAAIITVTMSGFTAAAISRYKPVCPIVGCSIDERVNRQLNLLWGVNPLPIQEADTAEELFEAAVPEGKKVRLCKAGGCCSYYSRCASAGCRKDQHDSCGRGRIGNQYGKKLYI